MKDIEESKGGMDEMVSPLTESEASYSPLQLHFLRRLNRLLRLRQEQSAELNGEGVRLIDRAIYSTSSTSPSLRRPVSPGVPVNTRSPGSSVITREAKAISAATPWISVPVFAACTSRPLRRVRSSRAAGSRPVAMYGPTGENVSLPLARHHCRSSRCQWRAETSLPQV